MIVLTTVNKVNGAVEKLPPPPVAAAIAVGVDRSVVRKEAITELDRLDLNQIVVRNGAITELILEVYPVMLGREIVIG